MAPERSLIRVGWETQHRSESASRRRYLWRPRSAWSYGAQTESLSVAHVLLGMGRLMLYFVAFYSGSERLALHMQALHFT
jgi:hypothetical protein